MANNAITSRGLTLVYNSNTIGEIMSMSGSGRTLNIHEIATVDSTDGVIEKIAGLINEGNVTVHVIYDGSAAGVYNDLNTDFLARTSATCLITHSDTSSLSVTALISSLGLPSFGAAGEPVELDTTFEFSGKITFTDVA